MVIKILTGRTPLMPEYSLKFRSRGRPTKIRVSHYRCLCYFSKGRSVDDVISSQGQITRYSQVFKKLVALTVVDHWSWSSSDVREVHQKAKRHSSEIFSTYIEIRYTDHATNSEVLNRSGSNRFPILVAQRQPRLADTSCECLSIYSLERPCGWFLKVVAEPMVSSKEHMEANIRERRSTTKFSHRRMWRIGARQASVKSRRPICSTACEELNLRKSSQVLRPTFYRTHDHAACVKSKMKKD